MLRTRAAARSENRIGGILREKNKVHCSGNAGPHQGPLRLCRRAGAGVVRSAVQCAHLVALIGMIERQ